MSGTRSDDPVVVFIAGEPGMAQRLLDVHTDDGTGRCRSCAVGAGHGRHAWPCTIHRAAAAALA